MSDTDRDWIDDMIDGVLPIIDWKTQSYFIRLIEDSTLSEDEQELLIDKIILGRFKDGELDEIKANLLMNARREIDANNPSQKAIRNHIKTICKL